jgi:hypothetical protein
VATKQPAPCRDRTCLDRTTAFFRSVTGSLLADVGAWYARRFRARLRSGSASTTSSRAPGATLRPA